jgi:hypothetical protein
VLRSAPQARGHCGVPPLLGAAFVPNADHGADAALELGRCSLDADAIAQRPQDCSGLVVVDLGASECFALGPGALETRMDAHPDHRPFEFGKCTDDLEGQFAHRRRGVDILLIDVEVGPGRNWGGETAFRRQVHYVVTDRLEPSAVSRQGRVPASPYPEVFEIDVDFRLKGSRNICSL